MYVEAAFRTILFTDIVESTSMTQRLGDAGAMAMVRAHDEIVRGTLEHHRGSEVKHTGDGLMAAFRSVVAIESAVEIQRLIADAEGTGGMPVRVRIGMAAGEPVTERNDLFGATVQLAARLCSRADPGESSSRAPCMTLRWARASPSAAAAGYGSKGSTRRCTPSRSCGGQVDRDPHRPTLRGSGTSCPAAEHGRLTAG